MGKELLSVFDEWADSYDETVSKNNNEYNEYFSNYDEILNLVSSKARGLVLEFGVGTGNLTSRLLEEGLDVIGIDPSEAMRKKAKEKIPHLEIIDGDFDRYPVFEKNIETIVSTYAFHHLNDDDKNYAISKFNKTLPLGGKVIFADVMFKNMKEYDQALTIAKAKKQTNVIRDLEQEYFSTVETMNNLFKNNNFEVEFLQCNKNVWLIEAKKVQEL